MIKLYKLVSKRNVHIITYGKDNQIVTFTNSTEK